MPLIADFPIFPSDIAEWDALSHRLTQAFSEAKLQLALLLEEQPPSLQALIDALEHSYLAIQKDWSILAHFHTIKNSENIRKLYDHFQNLWVHYRTELIQNKRLYALFQSISESPIDSKQKPYSFYIQQLCESMLQNGVTSTAETHADCKALLLELGSLESLFENNLLDATDYFSLQIQTSEELKGIPDRIQHLWQKTAQDQKTTGWVIKLDAQSVHVILSKAHNRHLRETIYRAYQNRASPNGPEKWNNFPLLLNILQKRQELAAKTGFPHYSAYAFSVRSTKQSDKIVSFLHQMVAAVRPQAQEELQHLQNMAMADGHPLAPWDLAFYQQVFKEKAGVDEEAFKGYFPLYQVIQGLSSCLESLYGLELVKAEGVPVWDPSVLVYSVYRQQGDEGTLVCLGYCYLDLYERKEKRSGAWMESARDKHQEGDDIFLPMAYVICNFTPPIENGAPCLLSHEDLLTFFHEWGHALHHLFGEITLPSISGINGVPWDIVELPSQLMESFAWNPEVLKMCSLHYQDQKPIPDTLLNAILQQRNTFSALRIARQLYYSLLDLSLHLSPQIFEHPSEIQVLEASLRDQCGLLPKPTWDQSLCSFSHIFSGGYAVGYYGYLWSESLTAQIYTDCFQEHLDKKTGHAVEVSILALGSQLNDAHLRSFLGSVPTETALLKRYGLKAFPKNTSTVASTPPFDSSFHEE